LLKRPARLDRKTRFLTIRFRKLSGSKMALVLTLERFGSARPRGSSSASTACRIYGEVPGGSRRLDRKRAWSQNAGRGMET
jgi:hypothetical protein